LIAIAGPRGAAVTGFDIARTGEILKGLLWVLRDGIEEEPG
jgi:hypothetical protein